MEAELPFELTRLGIEGADGAVGSVARDRLLAPGHEGLPWNVLGLAFEVVRPHLPDGDVKPSCEWAVRRAEPVRGPLQARIYQRALDARLGAGEYDRPPLFVQTLGPGLLCVGRAQEELARFAVEEIVKGVPVGHRHQLAVPPFDVAIEEDRDLVGI